MIIRRFLLLICDYGNKAESSETEVSLPSSGMPPLSPEVSHLDAGIQLSIFQLDDPALEAIRDQLMEVDIDNLTPVQALMKLHEIKATLTGSAAKGRQSVTP